MSKFIKYFVLFQIISTANSDDFSVTLSDRKLSSNTLVIAAQEIPPYYYGVQNGEVRGVFYKIAKDVCKQEKIDCQFFTLPFRRALHYIESGKIHITMPMGLLESRKKIMTFSPEILATGYVFFGGKDDIDKINDLTMFSGLIGVHTKSSTEKKLKNIIKEHNLNLEIKEETDVQDVLSKLERKRYKYIFVNKDIANDWQNKDSSRRAKFKAYDKFLSPVNYHIAYTKNFESKEIQKKLEKFRDGLAKYIKSPLFLKRINGN
ncbi:ABC transporter substrate-binding protein [Bacteriovorax sp. Seq25_V]|uniref:substrate-binding periplasmic protein n=1 Tax=Bacteriovorax sp. Seq25_V TaxID=1201288 RepID=UPI000389E4D3|nr:transporter substrate-binding domain-containing protein [Bacteriovorax sp. Seq25_V]EQC44203.1 ABC transporter, substrate-binding protein, family 3 [Bacteriovorax sp. Seq25_V]